MTERGEMSDEALRRALGFDETDAPRVRVDASKIVEEVRSAEARVKGTVCATGGLVVSTLSTDWWGHWVVGGWLFLLAFFYLWTDRSWKRSK